MASTSPSAKSWGATSMQPMLSRWNSEVNDEGGRRVVVHMPQEFYTSLAHHGSNEPYRNRMLDFTGINELVGTPEMIALGQRYETPAPPADKTTSVRR